MSQAIQIATTIKSQIRSTELMAIGAKNFFALTPCQAYAGGLRFNASLFNAKRCLVTVMLSHKDLYEVMITGGKGYTKVIANFSDVYAEDLEAFVIEAVEKYFAGKVA